jgi:outer membrane protein assembly factor BamB
VSAVDLRDETGPGLRRVPSRRRWAVLLAAAGGVLLAGCGSSQGQPAASSPSPRAADVRDGTRAVTGSTITSANVARLRLRWRAPIPTRDTFSGVDTAPPVVAGGTVYLQDMRSNVRAFSRATGRALWTRHFGVEDGGPNGVAVSSGRIFGSTDKAAFALDARTGAVLWMRKLAVTGAQHMNIVPVVANGLVYTSTVGLPPGGKGAVYGLDEATGAVRWRFVTIRGAWAIPKEAGGGGAWWPVSVDGDGRVYVGTSNPYPWGGTNEHPNGGAYAGAALYTDSLVVLDGRTGRLLWYDQVLAHDVRDYDFGSTPILATLTVNGSRTPIVLGAGKGGQVVAWNRDTHRRLWAAKVGKHLHDIGPLPPKPVEVCPGLLGGIVSPMAYADGRVYVPVVNLCMRGSSTGYPKGLAIDYSKGTGEVVALDAASGTRLWRRSFPRAIFACATVANDVVFTASYVGRIYALSASTGRTLWTALARAGVNACPTVDGDTLLVGAGGDPETRATPIHELLTYALP